MSGLKIGNGPVGMPDGGEAGRGHSLVPGFRRRRCRVASWRVRYGAVLAALAAVTGSLASVGSAGAAVADGGGALSAVRFAGGDRYETSLSAAEAVAADAGGSLEWLVVVSGERWTDAVMAAPLAGRLKATVLMSPPGELRADAARLIQRRGVERVVVVGPSGTGGGAHGAGRGVSDDVLSALGALGLRVERVAGGGVYSTAAAVARRVGTAGVLGNHGRTAIVASGVEFADALVAGPMAARGGHPVLLTPPDALHEDVAGFLAEGGVDSVVVMGGESAVSPQVRGEITALGIKIVPVSGDNRFHTAVRAAEVAAGAYTDAAGEPCLSPQVIGVARARVPFDSFSAAPLLARLCAPLLLTDTHIVPPETAAFIDTARNTHPTVRLRLFGGDAAVSAAAVLDYVGVNRGSVQADLAAGTCGGKASDLPLYLIDKPRSEDPAWSPDCSKIAYAANGRLWVADLDGTNAREINVGSGSWGYSPSWSRDGKRIAFSRGRHNDDGHWFKHIYLANADGTGRTKLSKGDVQDDHPSWSPDGRRIVFERVTGSGRDDDGTFVDTDRHLVVIDTVSGSAVTLAQGGAWEHRPVWSPDSEHVAYRGPSGLRIVSSDGTGDRVIGGTGDAWWNGGLAWSPDGSRIAYVKHELDPDDGTVSGTGKIVVAHVSGTPDFRQVSHQFANVGGWASDLNWSPDGQRIAFTHYDQTDSDNPWLASHASAIDASGFTELTSYSLRIQAVYAVPHGATPKATREAAIADSVAAVQGWFRDQTDGLHPVFERSDNRIAVHTAHLPEIDFTNGFASGLALRQALDYPAGTPLVIIFEGEIAGSGACGWQSSDFGDYVVVPIANCDIEPHVGAQWPYGASYIIGHELIHMLGAVAACAPNSDGAGHVLDDNRDILWQRPSKRDWDNLMLDVNHDDYYRHGRPDCPDIADHYLLGTG